MSAPLDAEPAPPKTGTEETAPSFFDLTPFNPAYRDDPYPLLHRARRLAPALPIPDLRAVLVTRHADAKAILQDRSLSRDPAKALPDSIMGRLFASGAAPRNILFLDDPDHKRLRGLMSKAFNQRAVDHMRPRIAVLVDRLLDQVAERATFDLIGEFAVPLPIAVIAEMLGVDDGDFRQFKRWSDDLLFVFNLMRSPEEEARLRAAEEGMTAYFARVIEERRARPREDLMGAFVAAEEAGDAMTDAEIIASAILLLTAGNLTTTDLIGNGVLALLEHPDELERLRRDPALIVNAVEEVLRYDGPVTNTGRVVTRDLSVGGCPLHRGEGVGIILAGANRDPSVHENPDRFDITRARIDHVAFGGGAHFCLGAPLARAEAQIAIGTLIRRFPRLRREPRPLAYKSTFGFRGLERLDLAI